MRKFLLGVVLGMIASCAAHKFKPVPVCPAPLVPSEYELICPETLPGWKCTVIL
jgi:hypothetical protein